MDGYGSEIETTDLFSLRCLFFFAENRQKLLNISIKIDASLKKFNDEMLLDTLLFGCDKYKETINKEVFLHTINFLKTTKCFERPLFDL